MDMQQKDQLSSLIDFFKNYQFVDQSSNYHKKQIAISIQQQNLVQYFEHLKATVKSLQNSLEVCVMSGCRLIDNFKQQQQHKNSQFFFLNQEYQQFKQMSKEDKRQNQKFLQQARSIIEQLKVQLLQKQQQCRQICDKLQERQSLIQILKIEEKQLNNKYQQIAKSFKLICEQQSLNKHKIEELSSQLQQYQIQIQTAEDMNQKIYAENYYLKSVNEELLKKIQKINQNWQNKKNIQSQQCRNQIKFADIDNESSFQKSQQENEHIFDLQDMNASLQNPNVLKDVLNISQQNIRILNMTRQFLRSKQKENWGQNYIINGTNSSKKDQIYMEQHYSNRNQLKKNVFEDQKVLTSIDNYAKKKQSFRQVKQFCMNEYNNQQGQLIDPYFAFFTLTIQCIKINSQNFQSIAELDLDSEWNNVIQKRIPLNQWQKYIKNVIFLKSGLVA